MMGSLKFATPGHRPELTSIGWGEPQQFNTRCSCGWVGIVVNEKWFNDDEVSFGYFAEPWRTIARTQGPDQTLMPGHVYGDEDTALKLVLDHVGYAPGPDLVRAHAAYRGTAVEAATAGDTTAVDVAHRLVEAAEELERATRRARVWLETPVPALPVLDPETQRVISEALRAQLPSQPPVPLTEEELTALRQAGVNLGTDSTCGS